METSYRIRPRDRAVEMIECFILQNHLPAHARLPSERDMCDMWGISRTTLRFAIQRLICEGKLYSKVGSGTFVSAPKLLCNLQDLKSFSSFAREAGYRLETRVVRTQVLECTKQLSQKLHLPLGHKLFVLCRLRILEKEPLVIETSHLDAEKYPLLLEQDFSRASLYEVLEKEYGLQFVRGQEKVGLTYATAEEADLLRVKEQTPVFFLRSVVLSSEGTPIEYVKSVVRSDRIRYASILKQKA